MRFLSAFRGRCWAPAIALFFLVVARPAEAQGERSPVADTGRRVGVPLVGDVIDVVGRPLADVEVALLGTSLRTRTDARGYGLGWSVIRSPRGQNTLRSIGSFGHTGAYGTEYWHDPATGVTVVFLAQTYGVDEGPRRQFSTMVNAALR